MTTASVTPEIQMLDVGAIVPSKTNRTLSKSAIEEMAASIKKDGILQPVTVRPGKAGKFELVFGECRFRGAELAGLEAIPAIVRAMSDEDAQREQIIENLQRSDPSPMDEATSYGNLKKLIGKAATAELVAAQVGKPAAYVAQRLKLLDLIPEAQKALGKEAIGIGHALLIAPLDGEIQKGVVKWLLAGQDEAIDEEQWNGETIKTIHTVPALRAFIERNFFMVLDTAPFDIAAANLYPKMGACTVCPHNTQNAGGLFPDHSKKATCTLPSCFFEKRNRTVEIKIEEVKKAGVEGKVYRLGLGNSHWNDGPGKVQVDGYLARGSYESGPRMVKAGDECKSTKTAVLVFRASDEDKTIKAQVGDTTQICTNVDCPKHGKRRGGNLDAGGIKKALSGMAFVSHKQSLLTQSRPERVRWAVYKALAAKLLATPKKGPAGKDWTERIVWMGEWANGHLSYDCARDAVKALGLWDRSSKKSASQMDWDGTLAKHYAGHPWAYVMGVIAAAAIRSTRYHSNYGEGSGSVSDKSSNLFRLAGSFKVDVGKIEREFQKTDKELIGGMAKRAKEKAAKPKAKKAKLAKQAKAAKPKRGTCQFCDCTMTTPCMPPCAWVDKKETICSAQSCVKKAVETGLITKAKAKQLGVSGVAAA